MAITTLALAAYYAHQLSQIAINAPQVLAVHYVLQVGLAQHAIDVHLGFIRMVQEVVFHANKLVLIVEHV